MRSYYLIRGDVAKEEGYYRGNQFILDRAEDEYDDGIWLLPTDGGYAQWYGSFEALRDSNALNQ